MRINKLLFAGASCASALLASQTANAQSESYIGEIQLYANTFCPAQSTTEAGGQLIAISQNEALFSLYGTTYGGDGNVTFGLPDLRGRSVLHTGQGPGLSNYVMGQRSGQENYTLTTISLPSHTHTGHLMGTSATPTTDNPPGAALAQGAARNIYNNSVAPSVMMSFGSVMSETTGGNQPVNNLKPYLTMRYCVVLYGIYPSPG